MSNEENVVSVETPEVEKVEQPARGESPAIAHMDEAGTVEENVIPFAKAVEPEVADDEKPLAYIDGDADLHNALKQLDHAIASGRPELAANREHVQHLLDADIKLRTRILGAVDQTNGLIDVVLAKGSVIDLPDGSGKQVHIPAGMHQAPQDIINTILAEIEAYAEEVAPATNMADMVKAIIAPLSHRALLGEIALLKLRQWYTLNVQFLPGRTAAHIGEVVADAESVTNGTFPAYLARMQGYAEPEWTFSLIPHTEKLMDLDARHMFVYADGREMPIVCHNFMEVVRMHDGSIAPAYDHSTLQLITADRQIIPARAVGCWRLASKEEIVSGAFDVQTELYGQIRTVYENTVVQMNAQMEVEKKRAEQAANARAAGGLILPSSAKSNAPKLILPGQ